MIVRGPFARPSAGCYAQLMSAVRPQNAAYRPEIDGLRAIAVLSVLLFHAYRPHVTGGFVGVDCFFVISGFLISGIIWHELDCGDFTFRGFYGRRIRRLFPALGLVMLCCLAYGWFALLPEEFTALSEACVWGAGFLSNILLWMQAGYFDRAVITKPLLHLWSLGVEEQFYIVWPIALCAIHRFHLSRTKCVSAIIVGSFALNVWLVGFDQTAAFYSPFTRFWELGVGALIADQTTRPSGWAASHVQSLLLRWRALPNWTAWGGLALIVASVCLLTDAMPFPGYLAAPPVLGAGLIILAGPRAWPNRVLLSARVPVYLGRISYPMYLWHWPLISYAYILRMGHAPRELPALGLLVTSGILASATYHLVEKPIRFGLAPRPATRGLAAAMTVLAGFAALCWLLPVERRGTATGLPIDKINAALNDPVFATTDGMHVYKRNAITIAEIGDGPETVLMTGDSLLMQFGPRVQALYTQGLLHKRVVFVAGASCPVIPGINRAGAYAPCRDMPGITADLIARYHPAAVIMGGNWPVAIDPTNQVVRNGVTISLDDPAGQDAVFANLEDEASRLVQAGYKVYIILPTPRHERFSPRNFVVRHWFSVSVNPAANAPVPLAEASASTLAITPRLRQIAGRTGAVVLDPVADICDAGATCPVVFDGDNPRYVDALHLRPVFVAAHVTFLDSILLGPSGK